MTNLILCIDIGTTSLKAALINTSGEVFAYNRRVICFLSNITPHVWFDALACSCKDLFSQLHEPFEIIAISISGNGPTLAQQDFLLLWNQSIKNDFIPEQPTQSFFLPRMRYIKDTFPAVWDKNDFILSGPEYLIFLLCGKARTLLPEARYEEAYWSEKSIAAWQLESKKLPPFVALGEVMGYLLPEIANQLKIPLAQNQIPLFCGGPDFIAALIGTNTLQEGAVCDRAGSSEGINVCVKNPVYEKNLRTLPSIIDGLWNVSVVLPDTGKIFDDFKISHYPDYSYNEVVKLLIENPCTKGAQLLEKIENDLKKNILLLEKTLGIKIDCMKVTGGQANSDFWLAYKSRHLGITLEVTRLPDAELIGNAIVALYGLDYFSSIKEAASSIVQVQKKFTPA
ncbi:MAG: hypothetical protein ACRC4W_03450 [Treponemataceae bacterium]